MCATLDIATAGDGAAAGSLDRTRVEAFAGRMLDTINRAGTTLLVSIGHQTGLFDTMAALPPARSDEIATAAGLNERYVREWLGGMTVAGIVDYEPTDGIYHLPPEHAASLTRAAGPGNLCVLAQAIPLFAEVEQPLVASFRSGGGVPYSAYPRFQQLQAELSGQIQDASLVQTTLKVFPGLTERLERGADVLDIGCGHGRAVNLMARAFPASRVRGYELSEAAVETARREAADRGLFNATFEVRDLALLDEPGRYDLITAFDVIHDLAHPRTVLRNIGRALRPDGVFLMIDIGASSLLEENIGHPLAPYLYTASVMHCMTVSLSQGGEGLGTVWGEQKAREVLREAGFEEIEARRIPEDFLNVYFLARVSKEHPTDGLA